MRCLVYSVVLPLWMIIVAATPTRAATTVTPGVTTSTTASAPIQAVVYRRGFRGYGPYGGAAYRSYYRPYYNGYYARPYYYGRYGYRPYGGWYY